MSRIRSIKPDFWSSEQVMRLSRDARLFFIGLWNFADDAGRFKWSPATLRAQIFAADDDLTMELVDGLLAMLVKEQLVEEYEVDGKKYGRVTGWHHQKINRPQAPKHPGPPSSPSARGSFAECSMSDHGPFTESSVNDHGGFTAGSDPKGSEGRGAVASGPLVLLRPLSLSSTSENEQAPPSREPSSSQLQTFRDLFPSHAFDRDVRPTPSLTDSQRREAVRRVVEYATETGKPFEKAAAALISQAFEDSATTGEKICFALADCRPGKPARAKYRGSAPVAEAPKGPIKHMAMESLK